MASRLLRQYFGVSVCRTGSTDAGVRRRSRARRLPWRSEEGHRATGKRETMMAILAQNEHRPTTSGSLVTPGPATPFDGRA